MTHFRKKKFLPEHSLMYLQRASCTRNMLPPIAKFLWKANTGATPLILPCRTWLFKRYRYIRACFVQKTNKQTPPPPSPQGYRFLWYKAEKIPSSHFVIWRRKQVAIGKNHDTWPQKLLRGGQKIQVCFSSEKRTLRRLTGCLSYIKQVIENTRDCLAKVFNATGNGISHYKWWRKQMFNWAQERPKLVPKLTTKQQLQKQGTLTWHAIFSVHLWGL